MILQQEREEIVFFGRKLLAANLTTGSGGNLSIFNRQSGHIAIKPTGVDYLEMRPEDVVVMNLEGEIIDGRLKPSSEVSLHLGLLKARPDINAVVHTHQVYAATLACLNWEIPAVHYLVGFSGRGRCGWSVFPATKFPSHPMPLTAPQNLRRILSRPLVTTMPA